MYRKLSIKGSGRGGQALGGALIRERAFVPSSGFLQNENRTIFWLSYCQKRPEIQ